jgi:hypothetical protein
VTTPIDLASIKSEFLELCGPCDAGIPGRCTCPGDYRPTMLALVTEVERLRAEVAELEKMADPCWTCSGKGCSDCLAARQ